MLEPFTERQIELVKTFADQAVIAIENVRLFKELQERNRELTEALEQQTATGEVLRVIASSPTELQPVLDSLLANAVKLSGATKGHIRQLDGESLQYVGHFNESPELIEALHQLPQRTRPEGMSARALREKQVVHILDAQEVPTYRAPVAQAQARTMLIVPLLREETGIGTITIWRDFVESFTERQIDLVKTFADQAVIAIENVRLFQELKESLEQQTATSEILGRHRQLADRYPARPRHHCRECSSPLWRGRYCDPDASTEMGCGPLPTSARLPHGDQMGELEPIERGGFVGRAIQEQSAHSTCMTS